MAHKQEIANGAPTTKIKKYLSTKTIFSAENSLHMANSKSDINLKSISSTKSKFFMPKPRISSHSTIAIGANNRFQAKSLIDLMKGPLQSEKSISYPGNRKQINENQDGMSLQNESGDALNTKLTSDMLATTISCVMLMASKVPKISEEYLSWAEYYLSHIRDRYGNHPPNVQGILNHIQCIRMKEGSPEASTPSNEMCLCVPDTGNSGKASQQSDRKKPTVGLKSKNSSVSSNSYNKTAVSNPKRMSSSSTIVGSNVSVQKTK